MNTEQYVFIRNDRLQDAPTVRSLARPMKALPQETACQVLLERFLAEPNLYALPIVDSQNLPIALIDRKRFIEFFTKPYSKELFGKSSILSLIGSSHYSTQKAVIIEEKCTIEDAARIAIDSGMEHMVTGFIVTKRQKYLGIANGHDLLNLITQRKQAELYYMAHYDTLTNLPNRALLSDRISQACRNADRKGHLVALLFVDVDRFKQINDSLGHGVGDTVLRVLVGRLKTAARRSDTVARTGGDEFVILLPEVTNPELAEVLAQRLLDKMRLPVEVHGHSLFVTISVGLAFYPTDDTDVSRLLAKADAAMYEAKRKGRNSYRVYSEDNSLFNPARLSLETDLRHALASGQLYPVYQPQVDIRNKRVTGVEVLLRWNHPVRGQVSPLEFIPIAEETGLIIQIGQWVLHRVFEQIALWKRDSLDCPRISVNISALQFYDKGFAEALEQAIRSHDVDPRLIELELTESVLMQNANEVLHTLTKIRELGVSLAIDDFGTGFSSLNYLRKFPIDRLKIDQSFVRGIDQTPENASITKAIIALASSLSMHVVAEGIENHAESECLLHLGCIEGQGYMYAKPMTVHDVESYLRLPSAVQNSSHRYDD